MNLTRCENGHFYDADRFSYCPHCNQSTISTAAVNEDGEKTYTLPLNDEPTIPPTEEEGKTIGYFDMFDVKTEPVVGWVVAINGDHQGESFNLKTGRNFIGRAREMDVALTKDGSVSRVKHAIILYEPKANIFIVQPGDAKELFYLNDQVVLQACEIKPYDVLTLGKTQLLFVPLCNDRFTWAGLTSEEK